MSWPGWETALTRILHSLMSVVEYSIIGERASISSVQWNVCMYSFFYGTFTHASTNCIDTA